MGDSMGYFAWVGSCLSMGACLLSWYILHASDSRGGDLMMKDGMLEYFKDLNMIGFAGAAVLCSAPHPLAGHCAGIVSVRVFSSTLLAC